MFKSAEYHFPKSNQHKEVLCLMDSGKWLICWYQNGIWMHRGGGEVEDDSVAFWAEFDDLFAGYKDSLDSYVDRITDWHMDRNLIDGSSDQAQFVKLIEEAGELGGNIARGRDVSDDCGDLVVVLLNIIRRNNLTLKDCLKVAWDDIKDRKGRMVDGVFIKETDL